ncbi:MAG TPA: hypothetical protein VHT29_11505, partial [Solirubrobacteraceae bacterium]|nr:hypothetical protein [Solirubrobacteraceae bacterium]
MPGGTIGEPCTSEPCGNGQLKEPEDVAVNEATGNVYVADKGDNRVEYFSSSGTYLGQFNGSGLLPGEGTGAPTGQISKPTTVMVDNACQLHKPALTEATTPTCHESDPSAGDVYVLDLGHDVIDKFTATGKYLNQITPPNPNATFPLIYGMYVDQTGLLWVFEWRSELSRLSDAEVNQFISNWVLPNSVNENAPVLAVDQKSGSYYFYMDQFVFAPERFKSSLSGVLVGTETGGQPQTEALGSETATGLTVEATSHDVYVDTGSSLTRYSPALAPVEQLGSGMLHSGGGVGVNNATQELYVADSSAGEVEIFVPRPPSAPTVSDSASAVTGDSATINATINPEGPSTSYRVEYGPTTSYGQSAPSPEGEVGSGYEATEVAIPVQGLLSHAVYHYRVVAKNSLGTTYGEDGTFTTQATNVALTLADERSWEMVSPPNKNGALFFEARFPVEAAASGDGFIGLASQPIEDNAQGSSAYVSVLMTRGSESWSSQTISPAHAQGTGQTAGSEYRAFSEDLSRALLQPYGSFTALSPEASETTPYLRTNYLNGNVNDHCTTGCFQPLATASDTIPGAEFGETKECVGVFCGPEFLTATPDLNSVLISSKKQLTSESAPHGGTYEWANGALHLVSSEVPAAGGARGEFAGERAEQRFGTQAISNNGKRIVLAGGGIEAIYLHEMSTGANIRIDEPEGGPGPSVAPHFAGASSDAARIFFVDSGHLTATSSSSGVDLYEYDMERPAGERLT